jgi:peptidoglycan/LPS O-acetylase OafA/YrhL
LRGTRALLARFYPARKIVGNQMRLVLLIIVIVLLLGALPVWPYSANWGYYPGGGLGLVLLILIILAITGRL